MLLAHAWILAGSVEPWMALQKQKRKNFLKTGLSKSSNNSSLVK
jgi:hypothetical protein